MRVIGIGFSMLIIDSLLGGGSAAVVVGCKGGFVTHMQHSVGVLTLILVG